MAPKQNTEITNTSPAFKVIPTKERISLTTPKLNGTTDRINIYSEIAQPRETAATTLALSFFLAMRRD